MSASRPLMANGAPCAGLVVGPVLWAANMQWGLILPDLACRSGMPLGALTSWPAALLALAAGYLSWRSTQGEARTAPPSLSAYPFSRSFVGWIGALASVIFAYALVLQALAGAVLSGCER